ncbi:MAG: sulfatase [Mariniblastus sp.]|nr:sulfatase [Mariniblastus sp.]
MIKNMVIACLAAIVAINMGVVSVADDRPPNFVVIFTDDQGYQDLGCFGSPDIRTPRLDAMAKQGMKFTSFYAQSVCGPSRAAIMTGCYPLRVAERGNIKNVHPILHSDEITIAEVLKTKGYATACFGKWDLAKHSQSGFFMDLFPTRQGFDYFYGTPTSNDGVANLYRNEKLIEPNSNMATLTKRYTDEAIGFMTKHKDEPFFVYIPHTMPHTRLDASPQFKGKSKRGLYGDVIEEIDFNSGRILDAVKELGLEKKTYVLFTSDNGPWLIKNKNWEDGHLPGDHGGSAGPLRSGKVSTFEGGQRVPTILWGPDRVPEGKTCDRLASTLDILPTFAALAGAETPKDRVIDGQDITHLFHGEFDMADPDKAFYYYLRVHLQAVRQGKWKLHLPRDAKPVGAAPFSNNTHIAAADRIGFDSPFLVDLEKDIGETTNVAEANPRVVKRLLGLAEAMREDLGDYDRVGKNMRFFDAIDPRPTTPPVPAPLKPRTKKPSSKKTAPAQKPLASAKLPRINQGDETKLPGAHAGDLDILAMSHFKLGNFEKANDYREQLNLAMKLDSFKDDKECLSFLKEVDELFKSR